MVLYAGFRGIEDPTQNFSIIFVFYTFWLGLVLLSVLFGDVFRAFNPWRAIGRTISGGFRLVAGQSAPAPFSTIRSGSAAGRPCSASSCSSGWS